MAALEAGKDVSVFVELTARFDEESNIHWTKRLAEAGAHVVYGVWGYKTHAKTALVIRKEDGGVARYVHIGTGNYNATTSRFYTDLGLMSADPDLGADLNDFFNELTGGAGPPQQEFRRLLVAPNSLVQGIDRMIDREIEHAKAGRPARIQAKVNGLADGKGGEAPVQGGSQRRSSGSDRPLDLHPEARCCGAVGRYPRPVDPGPISRALSGLLLRERRPERVLHRLGRLACA